jgi:cytochrome P450/NADPH-cytochrome P450 reductase
MAENLPIPHPPRYPLIGNLPQVMGQGIVQELWLLAKTYGPIFELAIPGSVFYVASSYEIVNEVCDETRFEKVVGGALDQIRRFGGDGLFTARNDEANWSMAHNILLPAFSMKQMKEYVPQMIEIAQQLLRKWAAVGETGINVTDDFTRLTLDTIALCGFDHRFNSFAKDELHPFLDAMVRALQDSLNRIKKTKVQLALDFRADRQFAADRDLMFRVVDELITDRLKHPDRLQGRSDFLSFMINSVDKKSGQKLNAENIRFQLITFLIAGHETTSGLLSFATYLLVKHPEIMAKAREEAERVLTTDPNFVPTFKEISELKYINQILRETLRLYPTAPAFSRTPKEDTVVAGKYKIRKGSRVLTLLGMLHRDPAVWKDPDTFDPDRFAPDRIDAIPEYAWRPFGSGPRSCIGQHFSMVEATLALGLILKHFDLKGDPQYQLKIKETLTIKPGDFFINAKLRIPLGKEAPATSVGGVQENPGFKPLAQAPQHGNALAIYYGSNMGTSEDLANRLAEQGRRLGFIAHVAPLDDAVNALPNSGAVVIITATYNGAPPDNALEFAAWLRQPGFRADGLKYTVFGCGNTQWRTFQAFPRDVDERLAAAGGQRLFDRGEADANADFEGAYESWVKALWPELLKKLNLKIDAEQYLSQEERLFQIQVGQQSKFRPLHAAYDARPFRIITNRELQRVGGDDGSERATRHIELEVPEGVRYQIGDHFGVFAQNRDFLVQQVAHRLGYAADTILTIQARTNRESFLPVGRPVTLGKLLREYIELQDVATRKQLQMMAAYCLVKDEQDKLRSWAAEDDEGQKLFQGEVLNKRRSVYDVLCAFPSCQLPLEIFLEMVSPLRPRFYSISSSPKRDARVLSLTVGVVSGPSLAANGSFKGVCSTFLQTREPGDIIFGFVKAPSMPFRLPEDPRQPVIMVGPGTGFAPFRGFLQERDALKKAQVPIGPAMLFFGCRRPEHDFIYRSEMEDYAARGIVSLHVALSHVPNPTHPFVQDRIWEQRDKVWELLQAGATIFVCGDGLHMAPGVRGTFSRIHQEKTGSNAEATEAWLQDLERQHRYLVDVFGQKKM